MKELIEILNQTSPLRVIFYSFIFLGSISIIGDVIVHVVKYIMRRNETETPDSNNSI